MKYSIGQYEFDTYEEYLDGQDDVKKIKNIIHEVDIYDPDAAVRLYKLIRNKKIQFKGKVGAGFFCYVSDIVAKNTQELVEFREEIEDSEPENSKTRIIFGVLCMAVAVICFIYFAVGEYNTKHAAKQLESLRSEKTQAELTYADTYVPPFDVSENEEETQTEGTAGDTQQDQAANQPLSILPEYQSIYEQNTDLIGWLVVDGTDINYPVMQVPNDNSYYLKHSFEKTKDNNGSLFVDGRNQVTVRDTNVIIYGHNMKSGAMFGSLKEYLDASYYQEHQTITFDTIYEKATYQVVGVGLSEVEYQDENTFKYYNFLNADSEEAFTEYLNNINTLSVFGNIDISYGDQLLTLSTCNSYTEDGRMFVLAKRVN